MSAIPIDQFRPRVRLPVRAALRLAPLGDIWHKPALSAVSALAVALFPLVLIGRLDLVLYAAAGAMCALYGHGLPYAARAGALAGVVLGMLSSTAVALVTAALTDSIAIRVAVAAILAGLHKAACDVTRIGPPGNVVLTFIAGGAAFVPQRLSDVPLHMGIGVLGGIVAWLVGMAPWLVRPDGPERIAVARALESVARLTRARDQDTDLHQARHAAAAAINAAWQTLLRAGHPGRSQGLQRLLARAETAAARASADELATLARHPTADADTLTSYAYDLRKGRPLPTPSPSDPGTAAAEQAELAGVAAERIASPHGARTHRAPHALARFVVALARGRRVVAAVSAGAALAGWASMALGVGKPYWAVVTAAAVFAANATLSWSRALQRVVGNLIGVALFTLLAPVTKLGALALLITVLALQFVTEAAVTRNYWLGSVFVTPMAIMMTEFAGAQPVPDVELREGADVAAGEWWSTVLPHERIAAAERAGHRQLAELAT